MFFRLQNHVSVFWNFTLEPRFLGKHHARGINLISSWNLVKAFYLPSEPNWKKSETQFCRPKMAEDDNVKTNVSPNIPFNFYSSKPVHFFKFSFRTSFKFSTTIWMEIIILKRWKITFPLSFMMKIKFFNIKESKMWNH